MASLLAASGAAAQEVKAPTPGVRERLLLENEYVRVAEILYDPLAQGPRHTHDYARVAYVVDGGTLELTAADGTVTRLDLTAGQTVWRPAETHSVRNAGRSSVRLVELEVKATGAPRDPREREALPRGPAAPASGTP
ncbi:MAG: cupin domain-containing protein [Gemmatimonadetes bacterium]|nr:cupin domain-containing protein [Gemmatimonadota bacterium]